MLAHGHLGGGSLRLESAGAAEVSGRSLPRLPFVELGYAMDCYFSIFRKMNAVRKMNQNYQFWFKRDITLTFYFGKRLFLQ